MLRFKKVSSVSILFFAAMSFTARAQEKISLEHAVALALERNLTIKQAQFTEAIGAADLQQAKNNRLPNLNANPQAQYNFGRSPNLTTYSYSSKAFLYVNGSASASVTLFQGGQLHNQILQNKLILDADKTATAKVKNDLVLNVVTDYLLILTDQDLVTAAKQQIEIAKLTLDKSQKSFNAGNQTLADLSQAKAGLSTSEYNLTTAQNQLDLAMLALKQYMEMDPNANIVIEKPDVSRLTDVKTVYDANEVIKTALSVNPDVRLAETQQQIYAQAIKIAKGNYYPTVSLFGGIGSNYSNQITQKVVGTSSSYLPIGTVGGQTVIGIQPFTQPIYGPYSFVNQFGDNFNQSVGVNVQIPIFNRFLARTAVKKAKINYENAKLTAQLSRNTLSKTIIQAVLDLHAAEKKYQSATQTFQSNKEAFNVIQQRYNVGLVNTLDYNTSLTNFNKAQNDMIEAKYEVIFRSKVIDYYLGNPITL